MNNFLKRLLRSSLGYLIFWGVIVVLLFFVQPSQFENIIQRLIPQDSVDSNDKVVNTELTQLKIDEIPETTIATINEDDNTEEQSYIYIYQDGKYVAIPSEPIN